MLIAVNVLFQGIGLTCGRRRSRAIRPLDPHRVHSPDQFPRV
jgi:hypothetical protein